MPWTILVNFFDQLFHWTSLDDWFWLCLADIYLFKLNKGKTKTTHEICSKLKTPEWRLLDLLKTSENHRFSVVFKGYGRRCYGVFIVNFEQISHVVLVFPLLTLNNWIVAGYEHNDTKWKRGFLFLLDCALNPFK